MINWYKKLKKEKRNIFFNLIFCFLNILVVSFLYKEILVTSIILLFLTIIFILYYKSPILIPVFVFCMLGALGEMYAITHGVWNYSTPNFGNIPIWLFVLWGNAGLFIYRTAVEFERLGFHK